MIFQRRLTLNLSVVAPGFSDGFEKARENHTGLRGIIYVYQASRLRNLRLLCS